MFKESLEWMLPQKQSLDNWTSEKGISLDGDDCIIIFKALMPIKADDPNLTYKLNLLNFLKIEDLL